jgi:hypothetical protein
MSKNYIGRLTAMLTARDAGFSETLAKARAKVASFGNEATKHTKTISAASSTLMGRTSQMGGILTNSIGGLVGGLSVIGAAYTAISNVGSALDRMGKSADDAAKLGMQDMPEFLAGLQYRAKLVGVEASSVSDSLGKLFRTIAEARAGSKADQDILSTLGLSVASLSGQSPDKVVLRIADALEQVADSGERARLAVALFGRSGANMVNVLRGGSGGIQSSISEAQSLGVAQSSGSIALADAAGDAIDRLRTSIEGTWNTISVELSPAIIALTNEAGVLAANIRASVTSNGGLREAVAAIVVPIANVADQIRIGLTFMQKMFEVVALPLRTLVNPMIVVNEIRHLASKIESFFFDTPVTTSSELTRVFDEAGKLLSDLPVDTLGDRIEASLDKVTSGTESLESSSKQAIVAMQRQADLAREHAEQNRRFEEVVGFRLRKMSEFTNRQIAEQEELYRQELELSKTVASEIMRQMERPAIPEISGGSPLIMSGSAEAQMAQFNAANMRVQTAAEQQLTITQRIDRELKRISEQNAELNRIVDRVLERIPIVSPL